MALRFSIDEPVSEGARRMAGELVAYAHQRMSELENPDKDVHETRKSFKKMRGLLRLMRYSLGELVYQRENGFYRDMGKRLSPMRESHVRVKTLDKMRKRYRDALAGIELDGLRKQLLAGHRRRRRAFRGDPSARDELLGYLKAGAAAIAEWPLDEDPDAPVAGLRKIYRQGRREMYLARDNPTTEALHDWRKRAKYLWYHTRILEPCWPPVLGGQAEALSHLGDLLGDDHDLADFEAELSGAEDLALDGKRLQGLFEQVETDRRRLQDQAFELAERIYQEPVGRYVQRMAGYWHAWRR